MDEGTNDGVGDGDGAGDGIGDGPGELTAQGDWLRGVLDRFFDGPTARAILDLARPAVRLGSVAVEGGVPLKVSRFGGAPVLPRCEPWPRWGHRPLDFLGVIDFAEIVEVAPIAGLPRRGCASFFYAAQFPRPWGDDPAQSEGWRVVPVDAVEAVQAPAAGDACGCAPGGAVVAAVPPGEVVVAPEAMLYGSAFLSLPGPIEPALCGIGDGLFGFTHVYEEVYRAWVACVWPDGRPRHQIGGWPVLVQRAPWIDCPRAPRRATAGRGPAAPAGRVPTESTSDGEHGWRLLLQIDSDERLGWSWGEEGRVYFSIQAGDAASGDFRRCWLTLQSR
jgi:hypothetical protein